MLRKALATCAGGLALSGVALVGPASAVPQVGLVNVRIGNITIEDVSIAVAAAVCGVTVNVLAVDLRDDGSANCPSGAIVTT